MGMIVDRTNRIHFRKNLRIDVGACGHSAGACGQQNDLKYGNRTRYNSFHGWRYLMDEFMQIAIEEAGQGLQEGGIPIGSVLVHSGKVLGRGHNRRVQQGSVVLHGEMDALENAGRQTATVYRECTINTTLSPGAMC